MRLLRFLSILTVFVSPGALSYVALPENCVFQKATCAVKTATESFKSENFMPSKIYLFPEASIFRDASGYVFLLYGVLRVQADQRVQLRSVFADFDMSGDIYFRSEKDKILVRNVSGDVQVTLRDGRQIPVPLGFEIWVSGLGADKKSSLGMYKKLDLKDHLRLWSQSFEGNRGSFFKAVAAFKEQFRLVAAKEVELYRGIAGQRQEEIERVEKQVAQTKVQQKKQNEERRKLFYERTFSR